MLHFGNLVSHMIDPKEQTPLPVIKSSGDNCKSKMPSTNRKSRAFVNTKNKPYQYDKRYVLCNRIMYFASLLNNFLQLQYTVVIYLNVVLYTRTYTEWELSLFAYSLPYKCYVLTGNLTRLLYYYINYTHLLLLHTSCFASSWLGCISY